MYKDDNLTMEDIAKLLQRFGNQTLDFFGAIRASTFDGQILCGPVLRPSYGTPEHACGSSTPSSTLSASFACPTSNSNSHDTSACESCHERRKHLIKVLRVQRLGEERGHDGEPV
jgi:hypothetical protein